VTRSCGGGKEGEQGICCKRGKNVKEGKNVGRMDPTVGRGRKSVEIWGRITAKRDTIQQKGKKWVLRRKKTQNGEGGFIGPRVRVAERDGGQGKKEGSHLRWTKG